MGTETVTYSGADFVKACEAQGIRLFPSLEAAFAAIREEAEIGAIVDTMRPRQAEALRISEGNPDAQ